MAFYDLSKGERATLSQDIYEALEAGFRNGQQMAYRYYADEDTYIRKAAYIATGRIYLRCAELQAVIQETLRSLMQEADYRIRQTAVNAAGEIGRHHFEVVQYWFDKGLFDAHHSVRNAVIGSVKKMGEVNPGPVLAWAAGYLHHPDKEIRREICHGIELRGRKYPEDILPMLAELQWDRTARVRNTLVHALGQIAYKKNCLKKVTAALQHWENQELVHAALEEIIDVHYRYRNFAVLSQEDARAYIIAQGFKL